MRKGLRVGATRSGAGTNDRGRAGTFAPERALPAWLSTPWGVALGAIGCCLLWGSAFPSIKVGYVLLAIDAADTGSQLLFAGVRFVLAGALVVVAASLWRRAPLVPARRDLGAVVALSLVQTTVQYALFYLGLAHATGVSSSIIEASGTFMAVLFGCLLFRQERLTARKVLGCALGLGGVALATLTGVGGLSFSPLGEGAILASAASSALSTCLIRVLSRNHDTVLLSGWQFVLGGLTLVVLGLALGGHLALTGPASAALLLYLAFVSAAAYTLWSLLLAANPLSRVAVYGFANPVFGAILSAVVLGEAGSVSAWRCALALALVAAGVVVVNRPREGKAEEAPA